MNTAFHIVLIPSAANWSWHIEDDELSAVERGKSSDYHEAATAALSAFDRLRKAEMEAGK